jgi:hypothetical protein
VTVSGADRAAMLRKYRLLAEWRAVRDRGAAGGPDRAALRAMADEFPGALRELDVLGLEELSRRSELLAGADDAPPWLAWIVGYHRLLKAALVAKRAAGRSAGRPAEGRLSAVVLRALAEDFGVPAERISTTLFPPRRPGPHSLGEAAS